MLLLIRPYCWSARVLHRRMISSPHLVRSASRTRETQERDWRLNRVRDQSLANTGCASAGFCVAICAPRRSDGRLAPWRRSEADVAQRSFGARGLPPSDRPATTEAPGVCRLQFDEFGTTPRCFPAFLFQSNRIVAPLQLGGDLFLCKPAHCSVENFGASSPSP